MNLVPKNNMKSRSTSPAPHLLPPFLMTSVPKSGSFLLRQILMGLPNIKQDLSPNKIFITAFSEQHYQKHRPLLAALKNNEFAVGHVSYSQQYAKMLHELNLKHVCIFRDPRDVLVSFSYFVPHAATEHPLYNEFKNNILTTKARCLALLDGMQGKCLDFYNHYRPFYLWLNNNRPFHILYEDIVNSPQRKRATIAKLAQYIYKDIEPPMPIGQIITRMIENINPAKCPTFRKGKNGGWRDEFDDELTAAFKEHAGNFLIEFGFEKNNNWSQ